MASSASSQKQESFDLHRYLDIVRRRHLHFLIPFFIAWFLVWGASWVVKPRYKSSTLILVQQPTMPKDYVQPNVTDDLQDRLQSITQQILSRTRLRMIIDKLHLYEGAQAKLSEDDKIDRMRKDISIELVRDTRNEEISAFRINYLARSPQVAQSVTWELTNLFVHENLRERQQESENTTRFIESQLADAGSSLAGQEAKVRQFQAAHGGELPSQQASNLQILGGFQAQLQSEQDALNTARQQRVYLEALLEQKASTSNIPQPGSAESSGLASIDANLSQLRAHLADLKSRYTDQYPDVQKTKDQIAQTEQMRARFVAESRSESSKAAAAAGTPASASTMEVQSQLQANKVELANREQTIGQLKAKIEEYQGRLNAVPATEQQLADLTRGYEQSKANFDDLLKKKNASAMATSMEQMQQGERFTMLDPPSLPVKPDFPNRVKFCGIGVAAGLGLGILVVLAFEYFDDRIYSEKDIRGLLGVSVISEIPEVSTPSDVTMKKRHMVLGWTTAVLVIGSVLAGSAVSLLHK